MRLVQADMPDEAALTEVIGAAFEAYAQGLGRTMSGPYDWLAGPLAKGDVWWIEASERVGAAVVGMTGEVFEIAQLAIHPDHQKGGIGRAALDALEDMARAREARRIEVYTAQTYPWLVAFYSRAGFFVDRVGPSPSGRDAHPRVFFFKPL